MQMLWAWMNTYLYAKLNEFVAYFSRNEFKWNFAMPSFLDVNANIWKWMQLQMQMHMNPIAKSLERVNYGLISLYWDNLNRVSKLEEPYNVLSKYTRYLDTGLKFWACTIDLNRKSCFEFESKFHMNLNLNVLTYAWS